MRNKKILGALLAVTTLATFGLAGCGNSGSNGAASKEDDKTITVAASPTPHAVLCIFTFFLQDLIFFYIILQFIFFSNRKFIVFIFFVTG